MQLSELPEDPEPSSSLGPCILRIICLQLLASLAGCALIFFYCYYRNAHDYHTRKCLCKNLSGNLNSVIGNTGGFIGP